MQLEPVGNYNKFSAKLKAEITNHVKSFGNKVRYQFSIANANPDPSKFDGEFIWPGTYTLDPCTWDITDPHEDNNSFSRVKKVGIVEAIDEKGIPVRFKKIRVRGVQRGELLLDLTDSNDFIMAMAIEMHPKLAGGKFQNSKQQPVIKRINEVADAEAQRAKRLAQRKATEKAEKMKDEEIYAFVDAMLWDRSLELSILRNQVEDLAGSDPDFFEKFTSGKSIEYKATVKRALDLSVVVFNPTDYSYSYDNGQLIIALPPVENKTNVDLFAEWLENSGDKAAVVYKKIKDLLAGNKK